MGRAIVDPTDEWMAARIADGTYITASVYIHPYGAAEVVMEGAHISIHTALTIAGLERLQAEAQAIVNAAQTAAQTLAARAELARIKEGAR